MTFVDEVEIIGIVKRVKKKKDADGFEYLELICGNKEQETSIRVGYYDNDSNSSISFFNNALNYKEKVFRFNCYKEYINLPDAQAPRIRYLLYEFKALDSILYEEYTADFSLEYWHLVEEYNELVTKISNADIRNLVLALTKNKEFFTLPAGLHVHHAYKFGLLEHSVTVAKISYEMFNLYPSANKDYLIAGGLLHDIGKVECYKLDNGMPNISLASNTQGHIAIGYAKIRDYASKENINFEIVENLLHIILSHHTTKKAGAVVSPCTIEAIIVAAADNLDTKMNIALGKIKDFSDKQICSDYDNILQAQIWNGQLYENSSETYISFNGKKGEFF